MSERERKKRDPSRSIPIAPRSEDAGAYEAAFDAADAVLAHFART